MLLAPLAGAPLGLPAWLAVLYAALLLLLSPVSLLLVLVLLPQLEVPQLLPMHFVRSITSFETESI